MADKTLSSGDICRPHRSPWGNFPTRDFQISTGISTAAINLGQPLTLDWTGSTTAGKVLPSTAAAAGPQAMFMSVGIAAQTISGSTATTSTPCSVWECNPMVEFRAVTKNGVLASSIIGLHKSIAWDSTLKITYVDLIDSTKANYRAVITDLIDNEGDSGGYVTFRYLSRITENVGSSIAITSTTAILAFYA